MMFHFGKEGKIMTATELMKHEAGEDIRAPDGEAVPREALIALKDQLKTIRMNGKSTLLVQPTGCECVHAVVAKEDLKRF